MKTLLYAIALGAAACLMVVHSADKPQGDQPTKIKVQITKAEATDTAFHIQVEVTNITDAPLILWDIDSVPGRESAAFIFPDSLGGLVRVFRKENQKDHSGRPRTTTIPPRSARRWDFDLLDQTWNVPEFIGSGTTDIVRVELSAPATETALRNEVWAGTVVSEDSSMNKTLAQVWTAQAIMFTSKLTK